MSTVVTTRPGRIGLKLERWSDADDQFLCEHYITMSMCDLRENLGGRSKSSVIQRAGILGLWGEKCLDKPPEWTDQEIEVLTMYYPDNGADLCKAFLPARTIHSVKLKIKRLGLRKRPGLRSNQISSQEWEFIERNIHKLGFIACADAVMDTPDNLRDKCSRKGFDCDAIDLYFNGKPFRQGPYSETELTVIREKFPEYGGVRVAQMLYRSPKQLINYAKRQLGLRTYPQSRHPMFSLVNPVFP